MASRQPNIPVNPVNPMATLTCGVFATADQAAEAVKDLEKANFPKPQIAVTMREGAGGRDLAKRAGAKENEESDAGFRARMRNLSPELGQYFTRAVENGKALLTVRAGTRRAEAELILRRNRADMGPIAVAPHPVEAIPMPPPVKAAVPPPPPPAAAVPPHREQLVGEQLKVEKTREPAGEVKIHKEVVTEPKSVQVPVEKEELVIERHPGGNEPAARPVGSSAETTRIPLSEEKARVIKEPVVQQEIDISKHKTEETKTITEPVRHEEAHIQRGPAEPHAVVPPPPVATASVPPPPLAHVTPPARALTPEEERERRRLEAARQRQEAERQRLLAEEEARRRRAA